MNLTNEGLNVNNIKSEIESLKGETVELKINPNLKKAKTVKAKIIETYFDYFLVSINGVKYTYFYSDVGIGGLKLSILKKM